MNTTNATAISETEVTLKPKRRSFTREYKLSILERADRCSNSGGVGELLRQEGLYSSHLASWRGQRHEGTLRALGRKRGPKSTKSPEQLENEKLRRDNARLRRKLAHAEKILEVQKKLSEVLGIPLNDESEDSECD